MKKAATLSVGVLLFDDVEELDVAGPYEVLGWAARIRSDFLNLFTVAASQQVVRCHKGLKIVPDYDFSSCPILDVIVVPGGPGTRVACKDRATVEFVSRVARDCLWVTSVCTGLRILAAAELTAGRRTTTYHGAIQEMRESGLVGCVLDDVRFVRDEQLLTSAGVSAGIDMSLWLVGELAGDPGFARQVQKGIEYFPAPPYTAEI